jgi:hypothetical protein
MDTHLKNASENEAKNVTWLFKNQHFSHLNPSLSLAGCWGATGEGSGEDDVENSSLCEDGERSKSFVALLIKTRLSNGYE